MSLVKNIASGYEKSEMHLLMVKHACGYGVPECSEKAVAQFKRWMDSPSNTSLEKDFLVYCQAISKGDEKEWNFVFKMFKAKKVPKDVDAIYGLSCAKLPWLINRYLQLSIDDNSPVPIHLRGWILIFSSWHTASRALTWDFFRENFKIISQIHGTNHNWNRIIDSIIMSFNTELRLNELKAFKLEQDGHFGSGEGAIQQAIQKVESNVQWMKSHYKTVAAWLEANVN